jgi:predicted amidophosphoribosyltransferase
MLGLLFPQRCAVCRRPGDQLCQACLGALRRIPPPWCDRCGAPTAWPVRRCGECAGRRIAFARARAAVVYDDAARLLIRAWKERGLRRLADPVADIVAESLAVPAVDALAFVPPDGDRSLARGHHPAAGLAHALGGRWGLPVHTTLRRTRYAARQAELPLAARRTNLRGAFAPARESPRRVCLVDDVYTSGGTAHAAASALRKGGARAVEVVTFARAVR